MLADLDELLLRCRDERAKAYIGEALSCYKASAYRAAIVSTWVAVTFDIIDKLRELALAGDAAAATIIEEFDAITQANDIPRAQRFERNLLAVARDRFELISPQESIDLERLQADRHRCAHPSQSAVGEVFTPTAELARFHIRSAVEHLLQHEPAQGKAALEGIIRTIESDYFPFREEKALVILGKSPLKRARSSLVRNVTLVLLKALIKEPDTSVNSRRATALKCIRTLHPAQWLQTVDQSLTPLVRACESAQDLVRAAQLLSLTPDIANALEEDQVLRLSEFVSNLPSDKVTILASLLGDGPLREATNARVNRLTRKEIEEISDFEFIGLPPQICDRLATRYARAVDFDDANEWGKLVQANAVSFTADQVMIVLNGALANGQIRGSFQLPHVLSSIRRTDHAKHKDVAELMARVQAAVK